MLGTYVPSGQRGGDQKGRFLETPSPTSVPVSLGREPTQRCPRHSPHRHQLQGRGQRPRMPEQSLQAAVSLYWLKALGGQTPAMLHAALPAGYPFWHPMPPYNRNAQFPNMKVQHLLCVSSQPRSMALRSQPGWKAGLSCHCQKGLSQLKTSPDGQ